MSRLRLTKEQKKIRKELIRYHRNLPENKEARKCTRKICISAIVLALAMQEFIEGKD